MKLAYEEAGSGELVVLLHGFPLSRQMWRAQIDALSSGYRVVAPDLRGHGASPLGQGVATMEAMADDVLELVDSLGVSRFVLGGLSMGGYVAFAFVRRHSERLRGLMLMDTRAAADTPEAALNRARTAEAVLAADVTPVVDTMMPRLFDPRSAERSPERLAEIKAVMQNTAAAAVAAALRGMACRPDSRPLLGAITVPTLVLVGETDVITPAAEAELMAQAIPGARLAVVPGVGHMAPVEDPGAVNSILVDFLASLPA